MAVNSYSDKIVCCAHPIYSNNERTYNSHWLSIPSCRPEKNILSHCSFRFGNVPIVALHNYARVLSNCWTLVLSWRCDRASDLRSRGHGFASQLGSGTRRKNLGQVSHAYVPLSPSSVSWYWPKGGDARRLGT